MGPIRTLLEGRTDWRHHVAAVVLPAAVTLLAFRENDPPTAIVAVLYVLAVVMSARIGGAVAGVVAAVVSFLALNFFFTSPLHTFAVGSAEDLVALVVFLATAIVVGLLLSSTLEAKQRAEQRESEAVLMNRLATRLLSRTSTSQALIGFAEGLCNMFDLSRCEIQTSFTEPIVVARGPVEGPPRIVSIQGRDKLGEIAIWNGEGARPRSGQSAVIESLATQLALALDGVRLSSQVQRAELEAQASQLKADLFSGVTHDVKTPLAAITTTITSLIDGRGFTEEDRRAHLETIRQEADRLHRVVNNLLDLARVRAGSLEPSKSMGAIDELMESVVNRLRPLLRGRPIELRVGEDLPEVPMDVVQVDQVLTNLLENAVKFTPSGTSLMLSAIGDERKVRVTVADSGPGIRKEDRHRIFEPFERAESSVSGTGLGLAISSAIVVAHGGRIWVSENPNGGAAFTFELPRGDLTSSKEVTDVGARAGG